MVTVFPHIRPAGIISSCSLQMRVLLENTTFLLHKVIRIAGIIRVAGIIRGRVLYEEIHYEFLQYTNPWLQINNRSSTVTSTNTFCGISRKLLSRGTEYVGCVVSLYFVTHRPQISKQWCCNFLVLHTCIGISNYTELA